MKTKRIRLVSKRRAAELRKYAALKKSYLERYQWCAVFTHLQAIQIHHSSGRSGKLLLDTSKWIPVSFTGHFWIHTHPQEARERKWNGIPLLCAKGKWNSHE